MDARIALAWMPLLALLVTMPIYAARGRTRDPNVASRPVSLLGYWLRDWMVWVLSPLERLLVRGGLSPDALNYLGAALGVAAGAAFVARMLPLAAWLIALGGICDILDGRVARARRIASAYGEFLDSTLDRFGETFTFAGVAWYLSGPAWTSAVVVLAIGGSLLVSYTRARGEALGVAPTGGLAQRAERLVLLAFGALLDPVATRLASWRPGTVLAAAIVAIAASSIGTALYRFVVIARAVSEAERRVAPPERDGVGTRNLSRGPTVNRTSVSPPPG
jgi:phosphatidylinositol phosphate synthase